MSKPILHLKTIREKHLLTQQELADGAKIAIGVISKAENGGKISLGSIKKLAAFFKIKPEKLIGNPT